jgi:DNA-binding HxlR family transcriptional regulator
VPEDRGHKHRATPHASDPIARKLRTGGRTLLLLSDPINASILRLLARGSLESADLGERLKNVSRSTRFERLRELEGLGVIAREKRAGMPPITECRLTGAGVRLLPVAALLEGWLDAAPAGSLVLGDSLATGIVKALTLGWGSTLLRWLAEQPRSLTELEPLVGEEVGYRELERILRNLLEVGLAERVTGKQRLRPYTVTAWARESTAPIAAAVRWERHEIPACGASVTAIDAESGLLLALPLIKPPRGLDGACLLLVETEAPDGGYPGCIEARLADGRLASCTQATGWSPSAGSWLRGTMLAWLDALIEGQATGLEAGGDVGLAEGLIAALHEALFRRSGLNAGRLFDLSR